MSDEQDPFAGTAAAYARSRPGYGDAAIEYLVERFDLDADGRVLDLGCGAGQLAVPLAAHAGSVVAMDPNAAMREATRERAVAADHENVTVREGSDADLRAGAIDDVAPLDLTTMGRSFHWMDERPTLDCLREHTRSGGGIAIVDDVEWLTAGDEPWTAAVHAVADAFLVDLPERTDPATVEYDDPWDELLAERAFVDVETATFPVERTWSADQIVAYVFSLSFASPDRFGDDRSAFEARLRNRLETLGGGPFRQAAEVTVVSGVVEH